MKLMSIPLVKEHHYSAPIEKVWETLIDEHKMREWYFPAFQKFKAVVGYKFKFDDTDSGYQKRLVGDPSSRRSNIRPQLGL